MALAALRAPPAGAAPGGAQTGAAAWPALSWALRARLRRVLMPGGAAWTGLQPTNLVAPGAHPGGSAICFAATQFMRHSSSDLI